MRIVTHKKRGTSYRVVGNATLQCSGEYVQARRADGGGWDYLTGIDGQQWRLYQSVDDGSFHVRPQDEFDDGRFEDSKKEEE